MTNRNYHDELSNLREFSARVGSNPLLTQASAGNSSLKIDGVLWIKASGKWMADAQQDDVLLPLNLAEINQSIRHNIDPAERHAQASIETAMHAVLPHCVIVHLHCVNTIAWAVREDAPLQLERRLHGLNWHWIPHVPSGLLLAREIQRVLTTPSESDILVLGNHGLVLAAANCRGIDNLLREVERRLAVNPRRSLQADYATLNRVADGTSWMLPEDDEVHALGTDPVSRRVLAGGLLFPGQSICSQSVTPELFHSVSCPEPGDRDWHRRYQSRAFLIIENRGVLVRRTITPTQSAMLSGVAQVVQRISPDAPIRYLSREEIANSYQAVSIRHRESVMEKQDRAPL